jgi:putative membrane protein
MSQKDSSQASGETRTASGNLDHDSKDTQRTLIICIDRDDDVGVKTGIKTPIVGRDACVNAAMQLALNDPEEADANAIFAAVREYDKLLRSGEICEVIVVSGLFERGVNGDRKIRTQVSGILKGFPASGAVLVSDGLEGEELAPVLQSLVPIISLKNVVIKHSKSVEESYAVIGRYFRMLLFDSRYSKYALGVPGIIFIAFVILYLEFQSYAGIGLIIFIGIIFVIRGFDLDRKVESIRHLSASGYLRFFSVIASVLIILLGFATGTAVFFEGCSAKSPPPPCSAVSGVTTAQSFFTHAPGIIGYFILNGQLFIWLGVAVYIVTGIFFSILRERSRHIPRYVVELLVLGLLYVAFSSFANSLVSGARSSDLSVAIIMFALAATFTIAAYFYRYINIRRRESQPVEP